MTKGYGGYQDNDTLGSQYNSIHSIILSILAGVHTSVECQVVAVTNSGGVSPVGFVDLLPLVNQLDGNGNATHHGIIHSCPYFRLQGGGNAVILDPQIGDIGIGLFAERDISQVIATRGQANPGSGRQFDMSDALYIGGNLNGVPTQYVQFSAAGIKLYSPKLIDLSAPDIQLNAQTIELNGTTSVTIATPAFTVNATTAAINAITAIVGNTSVTGTMTNNSVDIGSAHAHPVVGIQTGLSTIETGPPNV